MYVVVFKQKTAYEMRISDWSPDVCSSDLTPEPVDEIVLFDMVAPANLPHGLDERVKIASGQIAERDQVFHIIDRDDIGVFHLASVVSGEGEQDFDLAMRVNLDGARHVLEACRARRSTPRLVRSEEHTSELQSLMRISYAVFCLKKKTKQN